MINDGIKRAGNLIDTSGREHASIEERVQRLKSEAVMLQAQRARLTGDARFGHDAHAIGVLLSNIHFLGVRGSALTSRRLSRIECDLLAFWRRGASAVHALHQQRKELGNWQRTARRHRTRWLHPLLPAAMLGVGDIRGGRQVLAHDALSVNPWVDLGEAGA